MFKFLLESMPEFLASGKRPVCEETRPFLMTLPSFETDLLPLTTSKRMDPSAGSSQLGESFLSVLRGHCGPNLTSARPSSLEVPGAFQPCPCRLCQPLPDFRKEDQSDKELIAALAKSLCQSLADAFYSFLAAKQSLRKEFSIFTAIPIRELLNSYFLDPSLFGKDEVARVTAEARNLHCSIKEFLDRTAGKSKLVSNVA